MFVLLSEDDRSAAMTIARNMGMRSENFIFDRRLGH
jgi:hypothetical protein